MPRTLLALALLAAPPAFAETGDTGDTADTGETDTDTAVDTDTDTDTDDAGAGDTAEDAVDGATAAELAGEAGGTPGCATVPLLTGGLLLLGLTGAAIRTRRDQSS